jgi:exodeoxyribonuclease VII small subunit
MTLLKSNPAMANDAPQNEPALFDEILTRLRSLVDRLENGNLPLEESLRCFEEGMALCRRGTQTLDQAEKRVEILLAGSHGEPTIEPFMDATNGDKSE